MTSGRCSNSILSAFILSYVIDWTVGFNLTDHGLTSIPPNLSCNLHELWLGKNRIMRVEDLSFQCLVYLEYLSLDNNLINFISPMAFDPLESLKYLYLRSNNDLLQIPPSFGPNTVNILEVFLDRSEIRDASTNFMQGMASLTEVGYSFNTWNEFFDGCDHLTTVWHMAPSAPNLTERTPMLDYLWISGVTGGYLPDENFRGLSRLTKVDIYPPCKNIPAFEGATSLTTIDATPCEVQTVPNLTHLPAIQLLKFSSTVFECDPRCCWILLEDLTSHTALSWLNTIVCQGPENFKGLMIFQLSPVQTRCFEGEFHFIIYIWSGSGWNQTPISNLNGIIFRHKLAIKAYTFYIILIYLRIIWNGRLNAYIYNHRYR